MLSAVISPCTSTVATVLAVVPNKSETVAASGTLVRSVRKNPLCPVPLVASAVRAACPLALIDAPSPTVMLALMVLLPSLFFPSQLAEGSTVFISSATAVKITSPVAASVLTFKLSWSADKPDSVFPIFTS